MMTIFLLHPVFISGCGGGGGGGKDGEADVIVDMPGDEQAGDVKVDDGVQADISDGVELDGEPSDVPAEDITGDGDVEEEDAAGEGGASRFFCETSGGGKISSEHYKLELFIAPVRPVGKLTSENYKLKLGPASFR